MAEYRERILVVEDNPRVRDVLRRELVRRGYRVRVAANGSEALTRIRRSLPDLLLLDIMMDGMDGYQVCQKLRECTSTRALPILILSARSTPASQVAGLELGADAYVVKPFDLRELEAQIRALLRRCRTSKRSPQPPVRSS